MQVLSPTFLSLPGDFNSDDRVDAAGYVVRRQNDSTLAGYNTWRANFGETANVGAGASANDAGPEPAALGILILLGLGIRMRRPDIA
jgi:hypothetical protein